MAEVLPDNKEIPKKRVKKLFGQQKYQKIQSPELERYLATQILEEDAENAKSAEGLSGKIDDKQDLNTEFQRAYAANLFAVQARQSNYTAQKKYRNDPKAWRASATNRSRLVVIEDTDTTSMEALAYATLNANPFQRVLIAGLTPDRQQDLKAALKQLWIERLKEDRNVEFQKKLAEQAEKVAKQEDANSADSEAQSSENNEVEESRLTYPRLDPFVTDQTSYDNFLEERTRDIDRMSLEELMGPHIFQEDLDISFDSLSRKFEQFDANIEEVLCYGQHNRLTSDLADLGEKIGENNIPTFSIRSKPFEPNEDSGLWKTASNAPNAFLKELTQGKNPTELLGKNAQGTYDHVTLADSYQKLFDLEGLHGVLEQKWIEKDIVQDVTQEDLDYFKSIFFDYGVYEQALTPEILESTRAKASSIQSANKADELKDALKWNIVERPTSSAIEVKYAIGDMAIDGGGDITSEDIKKRNSYKLFFESVLQTLCENQMERDDAIALAFAQTLQAFVSNEKKNNRINDLQNGPISAKTWRALGVKYTNKVKRSNNLGIDSLFLSMPLFTAGTTGGWSWLAAGFITRISTGINWILGGVGTGIAALATAFKGVSMYHQIKANKTELNVANDAMAQANDKMGKAQDERKTKLQEKLNGIKKKINNSGALTIKNHVVDSGELIKADQKGTETHKKNILKRLFGGKKDEKKYPDLTPEIEKQMLNTLKTLRKEIPEIPIDLGADVITTQVQYQYAKNFYLKQAEVARNTTEKEYSKNLVLWKESGASRARLLVLEADQNNVEQLAESVLKASVIERLLITGLNPDLKSRFEQKLKKLWIEKLSKSPTNREQFIERFGSQGQEQTLDEVMASVSLKDLMGPHLCQEDLDLSPEKMEERFPQWETNIEEIACFGKDQKLVEDLSQLSKTMKSKVALFAVKSEALTDADQGLWRCSSKDPDTFLKEIIKGKSSADLIGEKTTDGGYQNIEISPVYQELFRLEALKEDIQGLSLPEEVLENLGQEDLDYFREMLFENGLSPGKITPNKLEEINSKSLSQMASFAGEEVGDSLKWNLVGNPRSTVKEVLFSILRMALDAGGDTYRNEQNKRIAYSTMFEKLKSIYSEKEHGLSPEAAAKKAFVNTVLTYVTFEKCTEKMKKEQNETQEWRDFSLDKANETKVQNEAAIKALKGSGIRFGIGTGIGLALLATTAVLAPPVALGLAIAGTVLGIWQIGAVTKSTHHMIAANKKYLPLANKAVNKVDGQEMRLREFRQESIQGVQAFFTAGQETKEAIQKIIKDYQISDIDKALESEQRETQELGQAQRQISAETFPITENSSEEEKKEMQPQEADQALISAQNSVPAQGDTRGHGPMGKEEFTEADAIGWLRNRNRKNANSDSDFTTEVLALHDQAMTTGEHNPPSNEATRSTAGTEQEGIQNFVAQWDDRSDANSDLSGYSGDIEGQNNNNRNTAPQSGVLQLDNYSPLDLASSASGDTADAQSVFSEDSLDGIVAAAPIAPKRIAFGRNTSCQDAHRLSSSNPFESLVLPTNIRQPSVATALESSRIAPSSRIPGTCPTRRSNPERSPSSRNGKIGNTR